MKMRRFLHKHLLIILIVVLVSTSGCVMQQGLSMSQNRSGWATTDLYAYDFFLDVLEDFEPFTPEKKEQSIMDASIEDFVQQLHQTASA
ncbi:MAG: hypothetical protein PHS67_01460, partial [Sphaerochaetaceae bacterium]|nr:hypothetical protein [Sphaerochaetaceae bacterium]